VRDYVCFANAQMARTDETELGIGCSGASQVGRCVLSV
jgi:hypothetical protein